MRHLVWSLVAIAAVAAPVALGAQKAPVVIELELFTEPGFSPLEVQKWYRLLTRLGVRRLRIGPGGPVAAVKVSRSQVGSVQVVRVQGRLTAQGRMVVPGESFSRSEAGRIARWLQSLRQPPQKRTPAGPFGLSESELALLRQRLQGTVDFSTQGQKRSQVWAQLGRLCPLQVVEPPGMAPLLDEQGGPVQVELKGLSVGTAMACLLRPAGLVLTVEKLPGQFRLVVRRPEQVQHIWPVGLKVRGLRGKRFDPLFRPLQINVAQGTTLQAVVEAFQKRLQMPVLVDHLALAAHGKRWEQLTTYHRPRKTYYLAALERLVGRAGLQLQVREDEAGTVFLWITVLPKPR